MKRAILILSIVFLLVSNSFAQAFHFTSVIATTNSPIGMVAAPISGYLEFYNFMLIIPKFNVIQEINTPDGAADIKFWDWKMRNFSAGFIFYYTTAPFTVAFALNYEKQGWYALLPRNSSYINFKRHSFSPEVCMSFYFGRSLPLVLEIGARRNFTFAGNGEYRDRKCYNNGFTGIYGIGVSAGRYIDFTIRYEHDYFNYFNQDFTAPNGTKPYQGFTTKHGILTFNYAIPFNWGSI